MPLRIEDLQGRAAQGETDAEPRAGPALDVRHPAQPSVLTQPDLQVIGWRVVDIVFLDPVGVVEGALVRHFLDAVGRREDLEHHLGGDASLLPLLVAAAATLGPTDRHHHVRGQGAGDTAVGHRVPEQVPGDEDIGVLGKEDLEVLLDLDQPFILLGIFRHGLTVALRVGVIRVEMGEGVHRWGPPPGWAQRVSIATPMTVRYCRRAAILILALSPGFRRCRKRIEAFQHELHQRFPSLEA